MYLLHHTGRAHFSCMDCSVHLASDCFLSKNKLSELTAKHSTAAFLVCDVKDMAFKHL